MDLSLRSRDAGGADKPTNLSLKRRDSYLNMLLGETERRCLWREVPQDLSISQATSRQSCVFARKPQESAKDSHSSTRHSDGHFAWGDLRAVSRRRKQAFPRKRPCSDLRRQTPGADYTASELLRKMCDVMTSRSSMASGNDLAVACDIKASSSDSKRPRSDVTPPADSATSRSELTATCSIVTSRKDVTAGSHGSATASRNEAAASCSTATSHCDAKTSSNNAPSQNEPTERDEANSWGTDAERRPSPRDVNLGEKFPEPQTSCGSPVCPCDQQDAACCGDLDDASSSCSPSTPSREKRKELRLFGKEYVSPSGKIYPERKVRDKDCSKCRYNCSQVVSPAQRLAIFGQFWQLDSYVKRLQYYCQSIKERPAKTMTNTRECSREYTFLLDGKRVRVCKGFYLATLDVSDKAVRIAMEKRKKGKVMWDKRGSQTLPVVGGVKSGDSHQANHDTEAATLSDTLVSATRPHKATDDVSKARHHGRQGSTNKMPHTHVQEYVQG